MLPVRGVGVPLVMALALVTAACGARPAATPPPGPAAGSSTAVAAPGPPGPAAVARQQALELLGALPAYPGAVALSPAPYVLLPPPMTAGGEQAPHSAQAALVASLMGLPATPKLVDLYRAWRAPATPAVVRAWVQAQLGAAYKVAGTGESLDHGVPEGYGTAWTSAEQSAWMPQLQVSTWTSGAGQALVRYDAVATYLPPRPPAEDLPAGATAITLVARGWPGDPAAQAATTVHDATTIAGLIRAFDALPTAPQGVFSCPALPARPWSVSLSFAYPGGDRQVTEGPGCGRFTVALVEPPGQPALDDGLATFCNLVGTILALPVVTAE